MSRPGVGQRCDLLDDLRCAWIAVPDPGSAGDILAGALGLERRAGAPSLPDGAGPPGSAGAGWALFAAPGEERGAICVYAGPARPRHGGLPRGWDSVEAVVADVDRSAAALAAVPAVTVVRAPFMADLSEVGSNLHRSGVWLMPWGTHLILTTGLTAAADRQFPRTASRTGPVFEVHLRTDRFDDARRLYADLLGMPSLIDVAQESGPMHEAWGLPAGHPVRMSFLKTGGTGTGGGAIELQGHPARALQPPAGGAPGGTAMVTCGTRDLPEVCRVLDTAGVARTGVATVPGGPYAGRRGMQITGAAGEVLQVVALR